jgi:amino acid adenylation domain-containing protein
MGVGVKQDVATASARAVDAGDVTDALNLALPVSCHAKLNPQRLAIAVEGAEYTYAQLGATAGRIAAWIALRTDAAAGSRRRGPRVGILAYRTFETYAGILGAAWAGGTYVPLNPKQPAARLESILRRAGLDAVIVDKKGAAVLQDLGPALPAAVLVANDVPADTVMPNGATPWSELEKLQPLVSPRPVAPDHAAYIMFTSGTTGVPKGVVVTAQNVAHFLAVSRALYHITPDDRLGQFCETAFDVSVFEMFAAWDAAASLHIVPDTVLMAPGGFIKNANLTIWTSVPSVIMTMNRLHQLTPNAFPNLRAAYFIGEALPAASARAWQVAAPNCVIDNEYGPTEATVACIVHRIVGEPLETKGRGTVAIGDPYPGMHAGIIADDGKTFLGAGEIGELALSGAQLAAGYLDDPEQTGRRFPTLTHPTLGAGRWYLTGDFAYFDENGVFHCLGRIDNQVKIMGHRVELEDLEAHLRTICKTDAVAAVAWPIKDGHATGIVAFVCGGGLAPAAARDELRGRIPAYMVPSKVVARETLPLNANGKVDRKALRAMLEEKTA